MLGATTSTVISPELQAGKSGTYMARVTIPGVPVSADKRQHHTVEFWQQAFAGRGINARVTKVQYILTPQKRNAWYDWSEPTTDDVFDITFHYQSGAPSTVIRGSRELSPGGSLLPIGMGAMGLPTTVFGIGIGWVIVGGLLAAGAIYSKFVKGGNPVVNTIKTIALDVINAAGDVLVAGMKKAGEAAKEGAMTLVLVAGAVALGFYLIKRSGAKVRTGAVNIE